MDRVPHTGRAPSTASTTPWCISPPRITFPSDEIVGCLGRLERVGPRVAFSSSIHEIEKRMSPSNSGDGRLQLFENRLQLRRLVRVPGFSTRASRLADGLEDIGHAGVLEGARGQVGRFAFPQATRHHEFRGVLFVEVFA